MRASYNNRSIPVVVNVYDISPSNDSLFPLGLGFYHSGVVVDGKEYTFSQSGVFSHTPRDLNGSDAKFRESIVLGSFQGGQSDIDRVLQDLRQNFKGPDYHIMKKNCNHFANAFSRQLIGQSLPSHINRMAECGNFFSCIVDPILNSIAQNQQSGTQTLPMQTSSTSMNSRAPQASVAYTPFTGSGRKLGS